MRAAVVAMTVALAALAGCDSARRQRASVEFHAGACRQHLAGVINQVPRRDGYGMACAVRGLEMALDGLPATIRREAKTRLDERLALAGQLRGQFDRLAPVLVSLRYDEAVAGEALSGLSALLDQIEAP